MFWRQYSVPSSLLSGVSSRHKRETSAYNIMEFTTLATSHRGPGLRMVGCVCSRRKMILNLDMYNLRYSKVVY